MARFIVSHRLSGQANRRESRAKFDRLETSLRAFSDVKFDSKPENEGRRRILHLEGDPLELEAQRAEWGQDVLIEPERPRYKAGCLPIAAGLSQAKAGVPLPGIGSSFTATIQGAQQPLAGASIVFVLANTTPGSPNSTLQGTSSANGSIAFSYDPSVFVPALLLTEPHDSYWQGWQVSPQPGLTVNLPALPKAGPIGWWHQVIGMQHTAEDRGAGVRVGIADTGVGPHPYLTHIRNLGSIINGIHDSSISSGSDVESHGTHVNGLIGARPADGSGGYAGIAEGAEIMSLRVFTANGGANQGDIAEAIDTLAETEAADIINLSLGGVLPSNIEQDAIRAALENGALCIVSAGNGYNQPVMYPAAYPEAVAVSAVGLLGTAPAGTIAANSVPSKPDQFTTTGFYLGNFSNIGPQIACTAPGVGIISTVPAQKSGDAPYADMTGTSLAAPIVSAALATLLSKTPSYLALPRDTSRAQYAARILVSSLQPLGLNPIYTGGGLCRGWPS